jgi:hypothetical protein
MKKSGLRFIFVFLFYIITTELSAQATVIGHITAEVVTTLTATETSQLSFGQFSPEAAGGEIILTPKGIQSSTGTVNVIGGMHNPGSFSINGEPEAVISIQLPTVPSTLTNLSNSGSMTVTAWLSDPSQEQNITIPASGSREVNVGATLIVGTIHDNPVGMYAGTYSITFNYN